MPYGCMLIVCMDALALAIPRQFLGDINKIDETKSCTKVRAQVHLQW